MRFEGELSFFQERSPRIILHLCWLGDVSKPSLSTGILILGRGSSQLIFGLLVRGANFDMARLNPYPTEPFSVDLGDATVASEGLFQ